MSSPSVRDRGRLGAAGACVFVTALGAFGSGCSSDADEESSSAGSTSVGQEAVSGGGGAGGDVAAGGSGFGGTGAASGSGGGAGGAVSVAGSGGAENYAGASGEGGVSGAASGGSGGVSGEEPTRAEEVCRRWNADRADRDEGEWNGNVAGCEPGDISPEGRANALRILNLYRWLADLPPIETDPERDRKAQACALLMEANEALSHEPPTEWACWSEEGAEAAGQGNISTGPGVYSVDAYMIDDGNPTTIGHRRWILSNSIGPTGLGSTGEGASCMWALGGENELERPYLAWPAAGVIPSEAFYPFQFGATLDETGWTLQSDEIELSEAEVQVSTNGTELEVSTTVLLEGYGSAQAIRFNPIGWETEPGTTYSVSITGIEPPISYEVEVVDCEVIE